jgi:hypothetical protein
MPVNDRLIPTTILEALDARESLRRPGETDRQLFLRLAGRPSSALKRGRPSILPPRAVLTTDVGSEKFEKFRMKIEENKRMLSETQGQP